MYRSRPLVLLIALLTACGADAATVAEPSCGSGAGCASLTEVTSPDTVPAVEAQHLASARTDGGRHRLEASPCPGAPLTVGASTPPLDDACLLWSGATPGRAGSAGDSTVDRSDSGRPDQTWAAKSRFTLSCWHAGESCDLGGGGKGTFTVQPLSAGGVSAGAIFSTSSPGNVKVRVKVVP